MQNKHYCVIHSKKIPTLTKKKADIPHSAGTSTIPRMMGKTLCNGTCTIRYLCLTSLVHYMNVEQQDEVFACMQQ